VAAGKAAVSFFYTKDKPVEKDTVEIKAGKFVFNGRINAPALASITILPQKLRISLFVEPGVVKVNADIINKDKNGELIASVQNSKSNDYYRQINSFFRSKIDSVYELYRNEKDDAKKAALYSSLESYQDKAREKGIEWVEQNLNSAVAAYYMIFNTNDNYLSFERLAKIVNGFGAEAKASVYYEKVKKDFDDVAKIQPGKPAPDFTLLTPEGKPLSLSSFKGKYVLIDFWASWCIPCRQSFPKMKELYEKYKGSNFEILGVSDDSKKEAWIKALNDDKLTWPQVVDEFPEKYAPARVGTLYAVHFIPSTVLIDKEGKIAAKNLHDEELVKILDNILKK
jgi:peroxiredoxin